MEKTKFHSWCAGKLCKGCRLCVEGRKLVLFITGLCSQRCFYCPVSELKFGKDVVFANEWQVRDPDNPVELIKEAELTEAKGAGITGGDPLAVLDRCVKYIKLLKERFTKDFHIHLYTPLKLVTKERLQKLYDAGLDEIRFHPDLNDKSLWKKLNLALEFDWDIGIEIPVIPNYENQTKALIDFIADKVKFLNLNELELSDTKAQHYKLDLKPKDEISYGVKGSEDLALELVQYAETKQLPTHYCTAKLKDAVQVGNRLKLRSKHVALPFDIKTDEGLLIRGCAYLKNLVPGVGYREKLKHVNKDVLSELINLREKVLELGVDVVVDNRKYRLLLPADKIEELADKLKQLNLVPAIVEEYPTIDATEMDIQFF